MRDGNSVIANVSKILEKFPEARNDDKVLFAYYWYMFDNVNLDGDADDFVETFKHATPPSSIQRARQRLQYEGKEPQKYLPTDETILKYRKPSLLDDNDDSTKGDM